VDLGNEGEGAGSGGRRRGQVFQPPNPPIAETRCREAVKDAEAANARAADATSAIHRLEAAARQARDEVESVMARVDLKQQEIDRLAEEVRTRGQLLTATQARESEATSKLSEAQASLRSMQLSLDRASEERELAAKQRAWYEEQLQARQEALLEARRTAAVDKVRTHRVAWQAGGREGAGGCVSG